MRIAHVACLHGIVSGRVSQFWRAKPLRTQCKKTAASPARTRSQREITQASHKRLTAYSRIYSTRVASQLRASPPDTSHVAQELRSGNRRSRCAEAQVAWATSPTRRLRRSAATPKRRCPQEAIASKHLQPPKRDAQHKNFKGLTQARL